MVLISADPQRWKGRYPQAKMENERYDSGDVTAETYWFDRYNTEETFDMDACFRAFDKDG